MAGEEKRRGYGMRTERVRCLGVLRRERHLFHMKVVNGPLGLQGFWYNLNSRKLTRDPARKTLAFSESNEVGERH